MNRIDDLVATGLLAFEVSLHHLVVGLDDGFDERCVRLCDDVGHLGRDIDFLGDRPAVVPEGAIRDDAHEALEVLFGPDRQLNGSDALAECLGQFIECALE